MKKNEKFGDWVLIENLGQGGNGAVWLAKNSKNEEAAIKLLWKLESKAYARFITEVDVIKANSDIEGILPILDSYLPEKSTGKIPWYVMPIAQPIESYLASKHFEDIVLAIIKVAKILSELHKRNIAHRDIKPENLLVRDEKIYLADFGLVDYPEKIELTNSGDVIGAKWTMAPEMRREGSKADGKPADVYSLAKTLWILITKIKMGFDGQYHANSINGLHNFSSPVKGGFNSSSIDQRLLVYEAPIDELLQESTSDNPLSRPTIHTFIERLRQWEELNKDWKKRNPIQWQEVQRILFPTIIPTRAIWGNIEDIVRILNILGKIDGLNHMFCPQGGGLDLGSAKIGTEPDTIELIVQHERATANLVKPKQLIFESFGYDMEWNYFRLENLRLEPTGIYESIYRDHEEVLELEPLIYVDRTYLDAGYYDGKPLPENHRLIVRHLNGDFVIFQKTSKYNFIPDTYDARHNKMRTDEFRIYIQDKINIAKEIIGNKEIQERVLKEGISMDDVVLRVLHNVFHKETLSRFRENDSIFDEEI